MLHTTYNLLRQAGACQASYRAFRRAATARGYRGDATPVPLAVALEVCGLDDTLWALRAVLPCQAAPGGRLTRLVACDYAEHVAPLWAASAGTTWTPAVTINVARRYAVGQATEAELTAAGAAAWAAAEAAVWYAATAAAQAAAGAAGAAGAAAWYATQAAAEAVVQDAAFYAAQAAAQAAARDAAGDAAQAAARDAERQWQAARLAYWLGQES